MGYANAPEILSLKAQVAAAHLRRIRRDEEPGDAREKHRLQGVEVPHVRDHEIEVVMRIELPALIDDVSRTFDVGDE